MLTLPKLASSLTTLTGITCLMRNISTLNWHRRFLEILSECIPQWLLPQWHNLPWLNENTMRCIRKHSLAFRAFKRSPSYNAGNRYKMVCNFVVSMIHKSRKAYLRNLNPSNKNLFWNIDQVSQQREISHPYPLT